MTISKSWSLRTGESPSICPFLKNNGHEAPKGPSAIVFQEWTDTRSFSYLKYTLKYIIMYNDQPAPVDMNNL